MSKSIIICISALILLSACTGSNIQQYSSIDKSSKTITVPAGSKGLKGTLKGYLKNKGWKLAIYRGPDITEAKHITITNLQYF